MFDLDVVSAAGREVREREPRDAFDAMGNPSGGDLVGGVLQVFVDRQRRRAVRTAVERLRDAMIEAGARPKGLTDAKRPRASVMSEHVDGTAATDEFAIPGSSSCASGHRSVRRKEF